MIIKLYALLIINVSLIGFTALGQNEISVKGNYRDSVSNKRVQIKGNKLIVVDSFYEFYGFDNTIVSFKYKISWLRSDQLKLRLVRSKTKRARKGLSHTKYMDDPSFQGTFNVIQSSDGSLRLLNIDGSESKKLNISSY